MRTYAGALSTPVSMTVPVQLLDTERAATPVYSSPSALSRRGAGATAAGSDSVAEHPASRRARAIAPPVRIFFIACSCAPHVGGWDWASRPLARFYLGIVFCEGPLRQGLAVPKLWCRSRRSSEDPYVCTLLWFSQVIRFFSQFGGSESG